MIERVFAACVSALIRSLRIDRIGGPIPERAVVAFWHSRMLAGWWASREHAVAMVSKSKDGNYLSAILSRWGYRLVRGSAGKSGMEALEEAMAAVRSGAANRLVLTPDGPRGPAEIFKRGAFIAARELELPLVFLEISYGRPLRLKRSWDNFEIPYPFSKVRVRVHILDVVDLPAERDRQEEFLHAYSQSFLRDRAIEQYEAAK